MVKLHAPAPSRVRFERKARSAHDRAEAGEIEVRAGDREPVGGHAVEHAQARGAGGLRIDVEDEPGLGRARNAPPIRAHLGGAGTADEWWSTIFQPLPSFT